MTTASTRTMAVSGRPESAPEDDDGLRHLFVERLRSVCERSDFYCDRLASSGVALDSLRSWSDIGRVPALTKEAVLADQERHRPFGTLVSDKAEVDRLYVSGGASYVVFSRRDTHAAAESLGRRFVEAGVSSSDLVDVTSTYHRVLGGTFIESGFRAAGAGVIAGGPGQTDQRIRMLVDTPVTIVQAFSGYAVSLGEGIRERGLDPLTDLGIRMLVVGGEMSSPGTRVTLAELWPGVEVREVYGTSEVGIIGITYSSRCDALHLDGDALIEAVDPDSGEPLPPSLGGELVITDLWREVQPFVRYLSGDIAAAVPTEPCPCGRPGPRVGRIVGRRGSIVRVKGVFLNPEILSHALDSAGIERAVVVITRSGATERLTLRIGAAGDDVLHRAKDAFWQASGLSCEVEVAGPTDLELGCRIDDRRFDHASASAGRTH